MDLPLWHTDGLGDGSLMELALCVGAFLWQSVCSTTGKPKSVAVRAENSWLCCGAHTLALINSTLARPGTGEGKKLVLNSGDGQLLAAWRDSRRVNAAEAGKQGEVGAWASLAPTSTAFEAQRCQPALERPRLAGAGGGGRGEQPACGSEAEAWSLLVPTAAPCEAQRVPPAQECLGKERMQPAQYAFEALRSQSAEDSFESYAQAALAGAGRGQHCHCSDTGL